MPQVADRPLTPADSSPAEVDGGDEAVAPATSASKTYGVGDEAQPATPAEEVSDLTAAVRKIHLDTRVGLRPARPKPS